MKNILQFLGTAALLLSAAGSVVASPITIDFTSPDSRTGILNNTYANQYNYIEPGLNLSVTGWSYISSSDKRIRQTYVGKWSGLGVEKTNSPNHAVDNENGDIDMLLLSFDTQVILDSIDLGWISGDSDMSIMAFNGTTFSTASLLNKQWHQLIGNGWQSAGNYYNVDYGSNSGAVNLTGISSQYWLIGAYSSTLGGFTGPNQNLSARTDYFKVKGVSLHKPTEVPEPGSLLLFALGLIGLGMARRRKV